MLREITEGGTIDEGADHFGRGRCRHKGRVVVTQRDGSNLGVDVEQEIAVEIGNVVAHALIVVGQQAYASGVEDAI